MLNVRCAPGRAGTALSLSLRWPRHN